MERNVDITGLWWCTLTLDCSPNAHKTLVQKLGHLGVDGKTIFKIHFSRVWMEWVQVTQNRTHWLALVNRVP